MIGAQVQRSVLELELRTLATDPDAEGDMTAHHVARALAGAGVRLTRLSRGLPSGSTVELASPGTLGEALENRREF